jgi:tRNA A-37 threonylcarbamoyl transferase component Bud32
MVAPLNRVCSSMQGQVRPLKECEVVDAAENRLLLQDSDALTALQAHRVIPQRRWVFSAIWQGQAVFAKVFLGKQADKYAARDARGSDWMQQAGLMTPTLLWRGLSKDHRAHVLIYAAVQQSHNADILYLSSEAPERLALLKRLVVALAQQHMAGLVQTDLHLKNFLVANDVVWAIDGDGIRKNTLSKQASYKQLSELISKLSVLDQYVWTSNLLTIYRQQRQWSDLANLDQILAWARHYKAKAVRDYVEHKIFRNCTDVIWQQTPNFALARSASAGLPRLTPEILEVAIQSGKILKAGNTSKVVQAHLGQWNTVIKRYNIKNILHALGRSWRPSRAASSWSNAHRLQYYGVLTPQPLAMLEKRFFSLRREAYFVSAVSALPDAFTFFQNVSDQALRTETLTQLALTCYQFYLMQISHGDMKATNLQVNEQGQIVVLDLDSMQQHRCAKRALRAHVKDIRRLLQNWKDDTSLYNALLQSFHAVYVDHTPLKLAGISI